MKRSKKKDKRKSCRSKVGHKTQDGAYTHIKKITKTNFIFHKLRPYKCGYCGLWHIGRTKEILYDLFDGLIDK